MTGCVTSGRCPHPGAAPLQQAMALGGALLVMGMRKGCSTRGEALLKALRRAGLPIVAAGKGLLVPHPALSFPHLGTGTGTSPSFSPNISLRASTFAEERGKNRNVSGRVVSTAPGQPWKRSPWFWMMHLTIFSTVSSFFSSSSSEKSGTEGWDLGSAPSSLPRRGLVFPVTLGSHWGTADPSCWKGKG